MPPVRLTKENGLTALACTECRKQHLKCDAKRPSCSRCQQGGLLCQYMPSRRGGRRKSSRHGHASSTTPQRPTAAHDMETGYSLTAPLAASAQPPTPTNTSSSQGLPHPDLPEVDDERASWPTMLTGSHSHRPSVVTKPWLPSDDRLPRIYYENFHPAHPILVPSSAFSERNYPLFLQLVVYFVGSHYVGSSPSGEYKMKVAAELSSNPDRSPCMVQAWLIYAIVLTARGEGYEAQEALTRAIDMALELGMNRRDFAGSAHPECSIEAESMRRTWWELYITEIYMAIPLKTITLRCSTVAPEVALPCEESLYTGTREVPKPHMILDFRRRIFAADDPVYSSFSYRIEATMVLCRVLMLNHLQDCHRDHLQAVENALVSWINHLPPKKLDIVDSYGNIDEMMFQAHLTIGYAAMLLHLPRSEMQPVLARLNSDQFWPAASNQLSSTFTRMVHSIKATEASRRVSDSISVCPNVLKHTPFIIPALALCGIIQVATCTSHSEDCFDHHCNRVTLVLGCLKSTRRTWELGDSAYQYLRSCAAEVMSASIERWNATPLNRFMPSEPQLTDPERPSQSSSAIGRYLDGHDFPAPDLLPAFLDPTCYNASFFSPVPDFNIT
ncbi:fungal-specific transcription factor domain-containing protein [Aspergillus ambiguus]|uniref:Zn(II)2Cys6 transcription factor n=1 Tax=Aspergillus ambiguus TaxID=176160 RepID=UPI003CCE2190